MKPNICFLLLIKFQLNKKQIYANDSLFNDGKQTVLHFNRLNGKKFFIHRIRNEMCNMFSESSLLTTLEQTFRCNRIPGNEQLTDMELELKPTSDCLAYSIKFHKI